MPRDRIAHVIYLHGFASSPASSRAQRFGRELTARGVGFSCPDFNVPEFETLTVTRMLEQTETAIAAGGDGPTALVGSSLGAFVAVLAAARDEETRIDRLVLLAPALDFGGNRLRQLGAHGIEEWRTRGTLPIFHYAHNTTREVGYALYEDAAQYDAHALTLRLPILAFQGTRDSSVDPAMVQAWCASRPSVDLRMVDDDHQLTASMELIWAKSEAFFGLVSDVPRSRP
jgi:pimeloyl-ACP methyl ester carboxylesterase